MKWWMCVGSDNNGFTRTFLRVELGKLTNGQCKMQINERNRNRSESYRERQKPCKGYGAEVDNSGDL